MSWLECFEITKFNKENRGGKNILMKKSAVVAWSGVEWSDANT